MAEQVLLRIEKVYKQRREADIGDFRSLYRFSKENLEWLAKYILSNANEIDFTETRDEYSKNENLSTIYGRSWFLNWNRRRIGDASKYCIENS